jgi:Mg2+/Co2+ transporter CorC
VKELIGAPDTTSNDLISRDSLLCAEAVMAVAAAQLRARIVAHVFMMITCMLGLRSPLCTNGVPKRMHT